MGNKYNCIQFNKKIINNNENYKIENNRNNLDLNKRKDESDEIKKDSKNSINLNTPSSPFEFNDIKNKDKNKDEKKEEKIKKNYIKCTDCELIYDTIEEMSKHYFSFHDKNRKNEKLENNNKNDINRYINQNFDNLAEKRNDKVNNVFNNNDLNKKKNENNIIDYEKEELKRKMQEDIEKIFEDKRMKIANKMKEITKNKGLIINDYQKREHIDILSDDEIRKIIREKRKEEINKISQETREKIKQLKKEKRIKLEEIKCENNVKYKNEDNKRKKLEGFKTKEGEKKRTEYEIINRKNNEKEIIGNNELKKEEEKINLKEGPKHLEEIKKKEDLKKQIPNMTINNNYIFNNYKENWESNIFICKLDYMKFNSEKDYLKHCTKEHPIYYPYQRFNPQETFLPHNENSRRDEIGSNMINNLLCEICKRRFKTNYSLIAHIKDKKHFQCGICRKIFLSQIALNSHCSAKNH